MVSSNFLKLAPQPRPLNAGQEWHVFLSYRSVNRGWVLNLYDILTELGFKVFLDQYVLKPSDELVTILEDSLINSQAGILVWSSDARDSDWVRKEYNAMTKISTHDKSFCFVPVKIDGTQLPLFADSKIFIDFANYPDGPRGGDLLRLVHGIVGKSLTAESVNYAFNQDEEAKSAANKIAAAIKVGSEKRLMELFNAGGESWKTTASLGCKVAEGLIKMKEPRLAIEVLKKLEEVFPKSIRPKQLMALALTRRNEEGDIEDAEFILAELYEDNHMDPETLGIYASTLMKKYNASGNKVFLRQSRNYYEEAFLKSPDDYYTAINTATKSLFLGEEDKAKTYAERALELTGTEPINKDYWKTATIAEALLLLRKYEEAMMMYQAAYDVAPNEKGSHDSTKAQMLNILKAQGADEEMVKRFEGVFG